MKEKAWTFSDPPSYLVIVSHVRLFVPMRDLGTSTASRWSTHCRLKYKTSLVSSAGSRQLYWTNLSVWRQTQRSLHKYNTTSPLISSNEIWTVLGVGLVRFWLCKVIHLRFIIINSNVVLCDCYVYNQCRTWSIGIKRNKSSGLCLTGWNCLLTAAPPICGMPSCVVIALSVVTVASFHVLGTSGLCSEQSSVKLPDFSAQWLDLKPYMSNASGDTQGETYTMLDRIWQMAAFPREKWKWPTVLSVLLLQFYQGPI